MVKAGRTASFRNATTVGGVRESNMFDCKMFDSEHRAWLSEGRERESKRGSSGNVEGRGGWHLPREWPGECPQTSQARAVRSSGCKPVLCLLRTAQSQVMRGVELNLPLRTFVERKPFKAAVKSTKLDRVALVRAFWAFLIATRSLAVVAARLFEADQQVCTPIWSAAMGTEELEAWRQFLTEHPACKEGFKWSLVYHKYVLTASADRKRRKLKQDGEKVVVKYATTEQEYSAKVKLEKLDKFGSIRGGSKRQRVASTSSSSSSSEEESNQ